MVREQSMHMKGNEGRTEEVLWKCSDWSCEVNLPLSS